MVLFPNAKINLGLHVTERRKDGFHTIETVFYPVPWCDALEIVPAKKEVENGMLLAVKGADFGKDVTSNLCYKAYELLKKDFSLPPVECYLQKGIPHGAGLGGGSSDAAFTLKLLDSIFDLKLGTAQFVYYASQLGSDCSFFIYNQPMLATGKGEILSPLNLSLKNYHIYIIYPAIMVSTAQAYQMIIPRKPDFTLDTVLMLPIQQWKYTLVNDFEEIVFEKYPQIADVKKQLYEYGAIYAAMSGSGSAVFGIFERETELKNDFKNYKVWNGKLAI